MVPGGRQEGWIFFFFCRGYLLWGHGCLQNLQGINPVGPSASLVDYKKEYFKNMKMSPTFIRLKRNSIHKMYPMDVCTPWANSFIHNRKQYQNIDNKIKINLCWKYLDHKIIVRNWPNGPLCPLVLHYPTKIQTWITWGTYLKPINVLMSICEITKTSTLTTATHKPMGEANPYVRFVYGPLIILNRTQWRFSVSMNNDPINTMHTSQQP